MSERSPIQSHDHRFVAERLDPKNRSIVCSSVERSAEGHILRIPNTLKCQWHSKLHVLSMAPAIFDAPHRRRDANRACGWRFGQFGHRLRQPSPFVGIDDFLWHVKDLRSVWFKFVPE